MARTNKSLRLMPPLARAAVPMTSLEADMAARAFEDCATVDALRDGYLASPSPDRLKELRLAVGRANLSLAEYSQLLTAMHGMEKVS